MLNVFFLFLWPQLMTLFPFWLFLWPIGSLGMCYLIAIYLWVFPLLWLKVSYYFCQKAYKTEFNTIKISKNCFEGWYMILTWRMSCLHLRRMYTLLLLNEILCICLLSPFVLCCYCNSFISLLIYIWMIHPLLRVGYWRPLLLFYLYFPLQIFLYMPYTSRFSDIRYL